ncbi:hypothetical protein VNO78_20669 [Psophocarpus tetragonolobus]|uniref:Uncharacterized protein n=1 Tax=Psophocarpus tetragonolobus TaxID=3891 RepID=A0AAN9SA87_PSOTE
MQSLIISNQYIYGQTSGAYEETWIHMPRDIILILSEFGKLSGVILDLKHSIFLKSTKSYLFDLAQPQRRSPPLVHSSPPPPRVFKINRDMLDPLVNPKLHVNFARSNRELIGMNNNHNVFSSWCLWSYNTVNANAKLSSIYHGLKLVAYEAARLYKHHREFDCLGSLLINNHISYKVLKNSCKKILKTNS